MLRFRAGLAGYTTTVTRPPQRLLVCLLFSLTLVAQQAQQPPPEQEPPEEDRGTDHPKEYALNPIQAEKEMTVGQYYFKRGSFKAAAHRFEEATKWNPGLADAFFRLGEARAKLRDDKGAREAFEKYLELQPDGKEAATLRKRYKIAAPKS